MAQDYGLLTSMAQGLREAGILYQTIKNQNRQADQLDRSQKLDELKQGVQRTGTGDYELTPFAQQQRDLQSRMAQHQTTELDRSERMEDPNSPESVNARSFGVGLLGDDAKKYLPETMSGAQFKEYSPMIDAKLHAQAAQDTAAALNPGRAENLTAETALKKQQAAEKERVGRYNDPKSQESANARALARGLLPKDKQAIITDDMSRGDLEFQGLIKQDAKPQRTGGGTGPGRLQLRIDQQSAGAVDKINKVVEPLKTMGLKIDTGLHTLDVPNVSWTALNEVAQEAAKVIAGGQVTDARLSSIKKESLDEMLSSIAARATSNPNQPANPASVKFWRDMMSRLRDANDRQIGLSAVSALSGLQTAYAHNPQAWEAIKQNAKHFQNGGWRQIDAALAKELGIEQPAAQVPVQTSIKAHPQDSAAVMWAKSHPNDPRAAAIMKANGQ
jgi:hypothetical protein